MEDIYVSDSIVQNGASMLYEQGGIRKPIKNHNWHHILEEVGWEKLPKQWITKLNKCKGSVGKSSSGKRTDGSKRTDGKTHPTNSLFGSLECGSDGDCLFHCLAHAINSLHEDYYTSDDIRRRVADSITESQFRNIISCYRCMKDVNDFDEEWDPYEIDTLETFKHELMKSGHNYWCDHLILQLIMDVFNVNILIISSNELTDEYDKYPLPTHYDPSKNTVVINHENECHFKLVGHFQGIMRSYFTDSQLPLEIKNLFNVES